ncbi:M48 family metallopeptidase [Pseudosporangium ferrugineum]|uniref:Zn-dependent protease with chaperone function n=1 Tax=Pseudosporangium ferrugineum TaxID=439699 RepID=A0A2T0RIV6_9ACTN|nr:M48 family metallopeptidase [Pseudosporangium ferrugineum]PRY21061.1 Zn-dependent protease with chaperone function [Pseudosporangium ferrugineum]
MQKRVWASAAALAGFLVAAAVQLALVVVPVLVALSALSGAVALRIGLPLCIATVGVMAYAIWRALHTRRPEPVGIPVSRTDAPALWALVDGAAAVAGTRAPDRVTIVADAAAKVIEDARLLGLVGGRRDLYLGLPLLQAWETAQLKAVVAHELGHFSPRLGRLAPMAYRGRVVVGRVVPRISRRNPAGRGLRAYASFYRRVDAPFSTAQELLADRIAAEYAGPAAAAGVLRDLPVLDGLVRVFHAQYLGPGWQAGHVPDDIFGGFLRVLAARAEDVAVLRAREAAPPSTWDTHPPRADRLAALAGLGDSARTEAGPEEELIPDLPGLGRALQRVAFPPQGRTAVGWDEFFGAARTVEMEREAAAALATLSRVAGSPVATASDVLDLSADGRLHKIAESVFPGLPADETAARITELLTLLLALAALRSRAARWRHSWTGTAELVAPDGAHLDLGGLAALAVEPDTVATAREKLAALGVDPAAGPAADGAQPRPEVVGGVVNLVVEGARTDVLVVDTGLFLVPGLPRSQNGSAKRRLAEFAAADVPQREAIAPQSRFVAYADVVNATQVKRRSWDLTLGDGGTLTVRGALDSDELPGGWAALDEAVAFLSRTR